MRVPPATVSRPKADARPTARGSGGGRGTAPAPRSKATSHQPPALTAPSGMAKAGGASRATAGLFDVAQCVVEREAGGERLDFRAGGVADGV